jgi:hypothetical protein
MLKNPETGSRQCLLKNGCCKPAMLIEKWVLQAVDCFLQSGNGNPAQKTE